MDADEHEQLDLDFESMLDVALGIESQPVAQHIVQHAGANNSSQHPTHPHPMIVGSPVTYDHLTPSCSPAASPVHCYQPSPCMSTSSNQVHAALEDYCGGLTMSAGLYSPVRESRSPAPNEDWPVHGHAVTAASSCISLLQLQQGQRDQLQQPPAAQTIQQHHTQQHVQLCTLPREVQMRVLFFLSADALSTLGCCNQLMCTLCSEPVLWRRLFVHRWGKKIKQNNNMSWKARYMECDASELRAAGAAADETHDGMQGMFVQALLAKRQQSIGRGAVDDVMLVDDDEIAAKVAAWRKSRGFNQAAGPGAAAEPQRPSDLTQHLPIAGSGHRQRQGPGFKKLVIAKKRAAGTRQQQRGGSSGNSSCQVTTDMEQLLGSSQSAAAAGDQIPRAVDPGSSGYELSAVGDLMAARSPAMGSSGAAAAPAAAADGDRPVKRQRRRWTQIGHVFCDEMTGWVHVCDETCSEKIVEPGSGLLVCPVSGAVSDRMMTCAEEEAVEGQLDGDTAGNGHVDDDYSGEKGRLARAFAAGYYCSDEQELLQTCGVRLSR